MQFYAVKQSLPGVPAGTVERFADFVAAQHVLAGVLVPFDERKHGELPGADAVPQGQRRAPLKCPACGK